MAKLLFADGLGQYGTHADLERRFLTRPSTLASTLASYTRTSGLAAKEVSGYFYTFSSLYPGLGVAVNPSTATEGSLMCRVRWTALVTSGFLFVVREGDGTYHLSVRTNVDGSLSITRGSPSSPTVLATTAAGVISIGPRYAIEFKWAIHDSTGSAGLRVNEVEVATFSGDTRNAGTAGQWRLVDFACDTNSASHFVGDVHVADATGGLAYLGDLQTDHHMPTGAGATTGGTPSAGANWSCVDEIPSNTTDYVSMTAAATKDTYVCQDLLMPGTVIKAVTPVIDVTKVDSGTATLKTITRRGGVDYQSTNAMAPSGGYRYLSDLPMEVDPSTSAAWTESNFNGAEFGFEKIS